MMTTPTMNVTAERAMRAHWRYPASFWFLSAYISLGEYGGGSKLAVWRKDENRKIDKCGFFGACSAEVGGGSKDIMIIEGGDEDVIPASVN